MKNYILTTALAFGLLANANINDGKAQISNTSNDLELVKSDVSPFCQFISKNDIETVKKLLKMGEDVNKFSGGKSPLMFAARYNRVEIIKLLIENGAKIKAKDSHGNTALDFAIQSGAKDAELLLKELLKKKKDKK